MLDRIDEGSWAVAKLPSGMYKLVQFRKNGSINLGKFGNFKSSELFGKPFEVPFEILKDGSVAAESTGEEFENDGKETMDLQSKIALDLEKAESVNNQYLNDSRNAQKLSFAEIEALKTSSLQRNELIKTLAENSATFDQKTEFSKLKYLKRKQAKFAQRFIPYAPCVQSLCEYAHQVDPVKYKFMRIDAMSQLLALANVRADGKHLVLEELNGLVTACILDRIQCQGKVVMIREQIGESKGLVESLNFSRDQLQSCLSEINLSQTVEFVATNGAMDVTTGENATVKNGFAVNQARLAKLADRAHRTKETLKFRHFDSLIIAGLGYRLSTILTILSKLLAGSCRIAVYSQQRENLVELSAAMRQNIFFSDIQLSEPWLREYQLPINAPGTHPLMSYSNACGYLLSAFYVLDNKRPEGVQTADEVLSLEREEAVTIRDVCTTPMKRPLEV